jgi:hypothetical protein
MQRFDCPQLADGLQFTEQVMSVRSRGIDVDRELENDGPLCVCAVLRRRFSVGANPTRQFSLQPVVIGAVMEVTKWLKPLV